MYIYIYHASPALCQTTAAEKGATSALESSGAVRTLLLLSSFIISSSSSSTIIIISVSFQNVMFVFAA